MSAKKMNADELEERRARAAVWAAGSRELHDRVNNLDRKYHNESDLRLQQAVDLDECDRIIEEHREYQRIEGAKEVWLSPYRVGSPLNRLRQRDLFDEDGGAT